MTQGCIAYDAKKTGPNGGAKAEERANQLGVGTARSGTAEQDCAKKMQRHTVALKNIQKSTWIMLDHYHVRIYRVANEWTTIYHNGVYVGD